MTNKTTKTLLPYLAYGSNLTRARLFARVGKCPILESGQMKNEALVFRHGFAATANVKKAVCPVVAYGLTKSQMKKLDTFEGCYVRVPCVASKGGWVVERTKPHNAGAFTYVMRNTFMRFRNKPTAAYAFYILNGLVENGLPTESYQRAIKEVGGIKPVATLLQTSFPRVRKLSPTRQEDNWAWAWYQEEVADERRQQAILGRDYRDYFIN